MEHSQYRDKTEREYLVRLLGEHQGNVKAAAASSGMSGRTLYRKLRNHELDPKQFRPKRGG